MKKINWILIIALAGLSLIGLFSDFWLPPITISYNSHTMFHSAKPDDRDFFETAYSFVKSKTDLSDTKVVGGIIPHHLLAADLIADFFSNLEVKNYDTVILLGPNHFSAGQADIITSVYDWQTPYGILKHDREVLSKLLYYNDNLNIQAEEDIIENEHAINSEVAFIKKTFPQATFVPIILKPSVSEQTAEKLAQVLFEISQNKNILVLASADFSHYKNSQQAQEDDKISISAIESFDFFNIYSIEVDSPPSIYTLLKFSQLSGAEFEILDNSNSATLTDKPDLDSTTSYITGYFVPSEINMLFVGDIMLDRNVKTLIEKNGLNYVFGELSSQNFFSGYDLIGTNLEGAVTNGGQHYAPVKEFDFAFDPETVSQLSDYGFNFFNLANNHLADQGQNGIEETRKNLSDLGFKFSGCADGIVDDCSAKIVDIKGKKIAMIGLSMVGLKLDLANVLEIIDSLREETDYIIVNIHWGEEYDLQANKIQQTIAHQFIDNGVDAVIGHHPHVVQEVEVYKDKPIFYSLGNFIFDQYFSEETQKGLAAALFFSKEKISHKVYELSSSKSRLSLPDN